MSYLQSSNLSVPHFTLREELVFFGNEKFATGVETTAPVLSSMLENGLKIKAIIINASKKGNSPPSRVEELGAMYNIPVHKPTSNQELAAVINECPASIAVLAAFGRILPKSIIEAFQYGIINIHPSLLPQFRGPTPIEQALLAGLSKTGVSIMKLVEAMDAGPLLKQWEVVIESNESKQALHDKLANSAAENLPRIITDIISNRADLSEQTGTPSYTKLISKSDGDIKWEKPAEIIEREVRAYAGWPGSRARLGQVNVTIIQAHVSSSEGPTGTVFIPSSGEIGVFCGKEALMIDKIKPQGKNTMNASAFLNGYKNQVLL